MVEEHDNNKDTEESIQRNPKESTRNPKESTYVTLSYNIIQHRPDPP